MFTLIALGTGVAYGYSLVAAFARNLNDEDRILAGQADKHDEADLRENRHFHAREPQADQRAEQTHRHDQDHGQRQRPAFVLGRQHEKDEDDGQHEKPHGRVARLELEIGQLRPLVGHGLR